MSALKYSYQEERGEFHGYVEDELGNVIFEMHYPEYYEDDTTGELIESSTIFEDGFMKHADDTEGLRKYLVDMRLINDDDSVVMEEEFERRYEVGGSIDSAYGHGTTLLENGGEIEEKIKKRLSENFELPVEMAVYVPSTQEANQLINKREYQARIDDVRSFLSNIFGGYSSEEIDGGYVSTEKGLIQEDVTKVVAFATKENLEEKIGNVIEQIKRWCKAWGQESVGFEFEGDLFYISSEAKYDEGGEMDIEDEDREENEINEHLEDLSDDLDIPVDVLRNYADEKGIDYLDLNTKIPFHDSYRSTSDFGQRLVDEMLVTNLSSYLYMTETDKRIFAGEEAESQLAGMDDEDIAESAGRSEEYEELKEKLERKKEIDDEIREIEQEIKNSNASFDSENATEEEVEQHDSLIEQEEERINELQSEAREIFLGLDYQSIKEFIDDIKNEAESNLTDNIQEELDSDAVGYFVDNLGYNESDLAHHSLFSVDYEAIGNDNESDYTIIKGDDSLYYYFRDYKSGGVLEHGGKTDNGNLEMVKNLSHQFEHHAKELQEALKENPRIDGWVVSLTSIAADNLSKVTHYLQGLNQEHNGGNPDGEDVIHMNAPLFNRELEYAREEAKSDIDLHKLTEKAVELSQSGETLRMDDYEELLPNQMAKGGVNLGASFDKLKNEILDPSIYSARDLKVGETYEWTIGAEPLKVKYLGLADENKDKKASSSIGKGFLFEWVNDAGRYVELGGRTLNQVLRKITGYAKGGEVSSDEEFLIEKNGEKVKLDGVTYKIKARFANAIYPYKRKYADIVFEPINKNSTEYKKYKKLLGDDWLTDWKGMSDDNRSEVLRQLDHPIFRPSKKGDYAKGGATDDLLEFTIPDWAMSAIVNDDRSGLQDEDVENLDAFENMLVKRYGNANLLLGDVDDKDNLGFCHDNDIDTFGSNCYKMYLRPTKGYAEGGRTKLEGWDKNNSIFAYGYAKDREVKHDGTFEQFKKSYFKEVPKEGHYNDKVLRYAYDELNKNKRYAKGGETGRIVMIPTYVVKEIKESVEMGYDTLVEGMIGRKRKGVALINKDYQVRGTYDLGLKSSIEDLIKKIKAGNFKVDAVDKKADGGGIPKGYHMMPDGTIMADSAHMAKGGENKKYEIYHETLSSALKEVEDWAKNNGYEIKGDYFPDVKVGGINYGETKRFSIPVIKEGKKNEGKIMIQIWRMDSGRYELNMYPTYAKGGDVYDDMNEPIEAANRKANRLATMLRAKGFNVLKVNEANYETDASIDFQNGIEVVIDLHGNADIFKLNMDGTISLHDAGKSFESLVGTLSYLGLNSKLDDGGEMAKGGATFQEKVGAIAPDLVGKEVPKKLRKDYGKKYNKKEALEAARRIVGSMRKKEKLR